MDLVLKSWIRKTAAEGREEPQATADSQPDLIDQTDPTHLMPPRKLSPVLQRFSFLLPRTSTLWKLIP